MTRLFGVMGYPITHSLSPVMHRAAFRALDLDAIYEPFEVPPRFLAPILQGLVLSGVQGLNVTIPLKGSIMPLLDKIDPGTKKVGAVNTIVIRDGCSVGYNTDVMGFEQAIKELGWRARPAHAVILGAGGGARAVCAALAKRAGCELVIANRPVSFARRLAKWVRRAYPHACVRSISLREVKLDYADLLINATPVGMRASDRLLIDLADLKRETLVYDLVYNRKTALIQAALRRGCVAAGGLSMLLYQAAESLRLWLHCAPPVGVMRRALNKAMKG